LEWLLNERFDAQHGLIWGATTVDWGDVQPEHEWGVELDDSSHLTLDIYDNAMFVIALDHFLEWIEPGTPKATRWNQVRSETRRNIRQYLWDATRQKFIPHIYLAGSPFPADFDESVIYYHGGTAVAIEAGLLSLDEIRASLETMRDNVKKAGASSIPHCLSPLPRRLLPQPKHGSVVLPERGGLVLVRRSHDPTTHPAWPRHRGLPGIETHGQPRPRA